MSSVVYFPHRYLWNVDLIKRALLLWDHVDVIDPFGFGYHSPTPELHEASELLVRGHAPSEDEKQTAHDELFQIFGSQAYEPLSRTDGDFEVFNSKFLAMTWMMLEEKGVVRRQHDFEPTWQMDQALSMVMMGALADACAGTTKKTVTDSLLGAESIGRYWSLKSLGHWDKNPNEESCVLASVPVPCIDLSSVSLSKLTALRKRERGSQGHRLTEARHRLADKLDEQAAILSNASLSSSDRKDINADFESWAERDMKGLREELGLAGRTWFGAGGMAAVVTTAMHTILSGNATSLTTTGALAVGGGLIAACGKYRTDRNKALDAHVMSYVHLAQNQGIEFDLR